LDTSLFSSCSYDSKSTPSHHDDVEGDGDDDDDAKPMDILDATRTVQIVTNVNVAINFHLDNILSMLPGVLL
jgi:hypothetical protein